MNNADPVWPLVERRHDDYAAFSDRVFSTPELLYGEHKSCAEHTAMLRAEGFRVTENAAGIPTAVLGEAGQGGPVIAILGEYDALPGLSQQPGVATHDPIEAGGAGHGCGHNLLGAGALMAAAAVKDWLAETGTTATVRYYGCPAEEGGAAKTYMVRAGLFNDVDVAISWHPATFTAVNRAENLANTRIDFTFTGKAAHAAAAPELGRSALDACELMNIGVNYMREHMPDDARVHYAYLDVGGPAPNVVQARATVRQLVRAKSLSELHTLIGRVRKIAEGAALMTETQVAAKVFSGVSNLLGNRPLEEAMQRHLDHLGPVPFDAADEAFAREIQKTVTAEEIASSFRRVGLTPKAGLALADSVAPLDTPQGGGDGSTDVGDVSWKTPTVQARVATCAIGTTFHTWQVVAQGVAPFAHKGMTHAAKVMAATAIDVIADPALLAAAKADHAARLAAEPYICPIPDDVHPPIAAE
ncbi:MAG: amidohydrolase [Pseudomonadota bacterium]